MDANTNSLNKYLDKQEENEKNYECMLSAFRDAYSELTVAELKDLEEDIYASVLVDIVQVYGYDTIDYIDILKEVR